MQPHRLKSQPKSKAMKKPLFIGLCVFVLLFAYLLHWSLPREGIMTVSGTMTKRNDGSFQKKTDTPVLGKDRYFISGTIKGKPVMYRNEDTNSGFPFHFKYNSAEIQAEAQNLVGKTCLIRYYGWRNKIFGLFPNITNIKDTSAKPHVPLSRRLGFFGLAMFFVLSTAKIIRMNK